MCFYVFPACKTFGNVKAIQLYHLKLLARLGVLYKFKKGCLIWRPCLLFSVWPRMNAQIVGQIFLEFNKGAFTCSCLSVQLF
jgi:hypothetical protein